MVHTINTISMQSLPDSRVSRSGPMIYSQILGYCCHVCTYFYRKLDTILYMPFQFWYLKCQFRHFKKASTILIQNGNIMVSLMYQADKSQKILALDTAESKGPRYEGSQGISRGPQATKASLPPYLPSSPAQTRMDKKYCSSLWID